LRRKISADGTGDPYPGLRKYLQMNVAARAVYNPSLYNKRVREAAIWAFDFLTLFCERQTDSELSQVLTEERFRNLLQTLLRRREPKVKRGQPTINLWKELNAGKDCKEMIEREYQIALLMAEVGVRKCLETTAKPYKQPSGNTTINPVYNRTLRDAVDLLDMLRFAVNSKWLA
jgi:hypothetical protein